MYKSKRGVSPLIATILLIAFAVALGAVVMNWGRGYVKNSGIPLDDTLSPRDLACKQDVSIKLLQIDGGSKMCVDVSSLKLKYTFNNGPNLDLSGYLIKLYYKDGTVDVLEENSVVKKVFPVSGELNLKNIDLSKVEILPKFKIKNDEFVCEEQAIVQNTFKMC